MAKQENSSTNTTAIDATFSNFTDVKNIVCFKSNESVRWVCMLDRRWGSTGGYLLIQSADTHSYFLFITCLSFPLIHPISLSAVNERSRPCYRTKRLHFRGSFSEVKGRALSHTELSEIIFSEITWIREYSVRGRRRALYEQREDGYEEKLIRWCAIWSWWNTLAGLLHLGEGVLDG